MIRIFFTESGYYVAGESLEISRSCSPATTNRGDRIFQPLHHEYKIIYLALCELRNTRITDDVMVYGNSRIIDEINGIAKPIDETSEQWLHIIRRHVIPSIKAVVFFRKKAINDIQRIINEAHNKMLPRLDDRTIQELHEIEKECKQVLIQNQKTKTINTLREGWFKHAK